MAAVQTNRATSVYGTNGNDVLQGSQHADKVYGGAGDDWLVGYVGILENEVVDYLYGGLGNDSYNVRWSGDRIVEYENEGIDHVMSYSDFVLPENVESLFISGDATLAVGNDENNRISGTGTDRDLVLEGRGGNDTVSGNSGNDMITGGSGNDNLSGWTGADSFVFAINDGNDIIQDFQSGVDTITFLDISIDFADLDVHSREGSTVIDYGSGTIMLQDFDVRLLNESDFVFL